MLENQVDYLSINESWFLIFKLHDSEFVISLTGVSCFFLSCFSVLQPTPVVLVCYSQHQLFHVYCAWLFSCFM